MVVSSELSDASEGRHFVIYLHGRIVEGTNGRPEHPRLGVYDFPAIVQALGAEGFVVSSRIRPEGAPIEAEAEIVAAEIRNLLSRGIPARRIGVVGHSKGGRIALEVSRQVEEPDISYAILAGCFTTGNPEGPFNGRLLSVLDRGDRIATSCAQTFPSAVEGEIVTETDQGHGLFFRPDSVWLGPVTAWLRREEYVAPDGGTGDGFAVFAMDDLAARRAETGRPYLPFFREHSLSGGIYELEVGAEGHQTPHQEDVFYVVLEGRGTFVAGGKEHSVQAGSVMFAEAAVDHRFKNVTEKLRAIVLLVPAKGG